MLIYKWRFSVPQCMHYNYLSSLQWFRLSECTDYITQKRCEEDPLLAVWQSISYVKQKKATTTHFLHISNFSNQIYFSISTLCSMSLFLLLCMHTSSLNMTCTTKLFPSDFIYKLHCFGHCDATRCTRYLRYLRMPWNISRLLVSCAMAEATSPILLFPSQ